MHIEQKKWGNVTVLQSLIDDIEKRVKRGDYANISDFVSEVVRKELQRCNKK